MNLPITIRASSTDRRFTCHGSLLAESLVPAHEDDDSSTEGSLLHYLIAARAVSELGAAAPEGGLVSPNLPVHYKLPAFSAWIVDWGVRWIQENIPATWSLMVEEEIIYRYDLLRPVWVPVSEITGPIPAEFTVRGNLVLIDHVYISGHIDILGISPDGTKARAADWKTGNVGAEPAETNWQGGTYMGLLKRAWAELANVQFTLGQPRIDEEATGIPRISTATLDAAGLDRMNATLAEEVNKALEDRYTTDSSPKACRYCNVALTRPWECPSQQSELMKAKLTSENLEALAGPVHDGRLGDFCITGRTLTEPIKISTEMVHKRIDAQGYIDADCGTRITRKITKGDITVEMPNEFRDKVETLLPDRARQARCMSWSKTALVKELADARGIPQKSEKKDSATGLWDSELAPMTTQGEKRTLVLSN